MAFARGGNRKGSIVAGNGLQQPTEKFPFPLSALGVKMIDWAIPLTTPLQGAEVAEDDELGASPSQGEAKQLRAFTEGDGAVAMAARQGQQHDLALTPPKPPRFLDAQGEGRRFQRGRLQDHIPDQLYLTRIEG